jgi:hypothetical protein
MCKHDPSPFIANNEGHRGWRHVLHKHYHKDCNTTAPIILLPLSSFRFSLCFSVKAYLFQSLTFASWSNLPNNSLRSRTNSWAVHCDANTVNPTISANRILEKRTKCKIHNPFLVQFKKNTRGRLNESSTLNRYLKLSTWRNEWMRQEYFENEMLR